jgi:3-hydroxy-D-aspartate aldolase
MKGMSDLDQLQVGFDIPARPGIDEADIRTPCHIFDLYAPGRSIRKRSNGAAAHGMRHRVHGMMQNSVNAAQVRENRGCACRVRCQSI